MKKLDKYSFCESTHAGPGDPWHIRELTSKGQRFGGGVDTLALCGRVRVGWDLDVPVTEHHLDKNTCLACMRLYRLRKMGVK